MPNTLCKTGATTPVIRSVSPNPMITEETIEKGKVINKLGHSFKDGVCEECGAEEEFVKQQKDGYFEITTFEDLILYLKNIAVFLIVMYLWYLVLKENNRY